MNGKSLSKLELLFLPYGDLVVASFDSSHCLAKMLRLKWA